VRIKLATIFVVLLAMIATPCFGWGPDGHRIVGAIAMTYLTEKTKAAIHDLLGEQSLPDACNWADELRSDSSYDWAKPLHYINVPRGVTKVDLERDCKSEKCVLGAIKKYEAMLRDKQAPREQRVEALKFLVHFIGDVHQPMHVSYEDDQGGNKVSVSGAWLPVNQSGDPAKQRKWNLHSVWDSGLIEHRMAGDRDKMIQDIRRRITDRKLALWRKSKNAVDWANESLAITIKLYQLLPANGQLDESYYRRNIGITEDRLAAAGVRVAAMLNDIFDDAPASPPNANPLSRPQAVPQDTPKPEPAAKP